MTKKNVFENAPRIKNPAAVIRQLAKQNPLMDLHVDYMDKLSASELQWLANFTLMQCGSRYHCETEEIRKENTHDRGMLASDCMALRKDVGGDLTRLDVADPQPNPETLALYNDLYSKGQLPEQLKAAAKRKARRQH